MDTELLCKIKNLYSQGFSDHYTLSANLEALRDTFVSALEDYYRYNVSRIDFTDFPAFDITSNNHQLIVLLIWNEPGHAQDANLLLGETNMASCTADTTIGFSRCVLANPDESTPGNQWQVVAAGGAFSPPPDMRIVLADPKVLSHFAIDRVAHGTGLNLTLTAELKQGGRRLTGDSENGPIKVAVEIEGPEEGFGNFVSTHSPYDCRDIVPALPTVDPTVLLAVDVKAATTGAVSNALPSAGSRDPPAQHFTLMQNVLNACGKNGLESFTGSRELRDEGSNGDKNAGDGIHTYQFIPEVAGTYTFRFNVEGKSLDDEKFTRTKRFSEYVRVEVTPSNTSVDSRLVQREKNLVTRQYYVTPRDKFGNYLGPGHAQQVAFSTTSGKWLDPVTDNIDDAPGIYSRLLRYDVAQGEPRVVATVQGKALPAITGKAFELFPLVGRTMFDNSLALDDGPLLGIQFNYRLNEKWFTGLELAQTNTETTAGDSGKMAQAFANFRYEPRAWFPGEVNPHIGAGLGYVWFRDFTNEDQAFAMHGNAGATYNFTDYFGARVEARLLYIGDVLSKGATTNTQIDVGLVFRFD